MKNMLRLFDFITAFGFVLLIGTAGASDCGRIGLYEIIGQGSLSVLLMLIGLLGRKTMLHQKKPKRVQKYFEKVSFAA